MAQCNTELRFVNARTYANKGEHRLDFIASNIWMIRQTAVLTLITLICRQLPAERQTHWRISRSDCEAQILIHEADAERTARSSERIRIRAGVGSYCDAVREIEPVRVIDDLDIRVWTKTDRPGIQIFARIVFPNAISQEHEGLVSIRIPGGTHNRPGIWQQLTLREVPRQIQEQVFQIRQKHGSEIDLRGSYIDRIEANIFGGPGTTNVWFGEIALNGAIRVKDAGFTVNGSLVRQASHVRPDQPINRIEVDGSALRINDRVFVPRIVRYRGESLSLIDELGCNTVVLDDGPTDEQILEASRLGMWFICPLPDAREFSRKSFERVLVWNAGEKLVQQDLRSVSERIAACRRNDKRQIPIAAGVVEGFREFGRVADILVVGAQLMDAIADEAAFDRLRSVMESVRPGIPIWATIPTFNASFSANGFSPSVSAQRLRQQCLVAFAGGSQSIWFDSASQLSDERSVQRRVAISSINLQMRALQPWARSNRSKIMTRSGRTFAQLQTTAGSVAIPISHRNQEPTPSEFLVVASTADSSDAFALLPIGLQPLPHQRQSGGIRVTLRDTDPDSPILVTSNQLAINQLAKLSSVTKQKAVELIEQLALLEQQDARSRKIGSANSHAYRSAAESIRRGTRLLDSGDATAAYRFFQSARRDLAAAVVSAN